MSPTVANVDTTGEAPLSHGGMLDEREMDEAQAARREEHPVQVFNERVRSELDLPNSQSVKEVISAITKQVSRLSLVDPKEIKPQAAHIGKLIAKEREEMNDPQLWDGPAAKVAEHILKLRVAGEAPEADSVQEG